MKLCCEYCKKLEDNWIVLHSMSSGHFCNRCGKESKKLNALYVGQKVSFNWNDGVMITEVYEIEGESYFCFMPMTKKIEVFARYELTRRALKTAFRRTGQY